MSISYRKNVKLNGRRNKITKKRRVWGFVLFLTSTLLFPIVFGITYYMNKRYYFTLKEFWVAYVEALKDMLKGTWRNY